jgi:hypothetical protein
LVNPTFTKSKVLRAMKHPLKTTKMLLKKK